MRGDRPRHGVLEVGLPPPPFLNRHMRRGRRDGLRTGHGNGAVEAPGWENHYQDESNESGHSVKGPPPVPKPCTTRHHESLPEMGGEETIPFYEFQCQDCQKEFSLTLSLRERETGEMECPGCKNKRLKSLMAGFFAKTSRKS